jgi:hypothetical protein
MQDFVMSFLCEDENPDQEHDDQWHDAIKEEIKSHITNQTWDLVDARENANVIGCKMVLKQKFNSDGTLERNEARLVA